MRHEYGAIPIRPRPFVLSPADRAMLLEAGISCPDPDSRA
jgi:hypothetical protein